MHLVVVALLATAPIEVIDRGGACPSSVDVALALAPLFPSVKVTAAPARPGARVIRIDDLGARFYAALDGIGRLFDDPARRCGERARTAAAFLALALEPPATLPRAAPRPAHARWSAGIELGAILAGAPRSAPANRLVSGGAGLRAWIGNRYVAAALGVSGLSPAASAFTVAGARVSAELTRVPIDLSVRGRLPLRALELSGDLGVVFGVLVIRGGGTLNTPQSTRAELGVRAQIAARYWIRGRVAPWIGFEVIGLPRAYTLAADPVGALGTTPQLWLAGNLGLAVRIR